MCYSLEASIITYLVTLPIFIFFILSKNLDYKIVGIIFTYIIQMQLLEGLMWADQSCTGLNQIASRLSVYFTLFQPMVVFLAVMYINKQRGQKVNPNLVYAMVPYFIFLVYHLLQKIRPSDLCTTPYKNGDHWLVWKWNRVKYPIIWLISLFIPLFFLYKNKITSVISLAMIYIAVSFVISFLLLPKNGYLGSIWCFAQGFLAVLLLAYYFYQKYKNKN